MNSACGCYRPKMVVGDAGHGEITAFPSGLTEQKIPYMIAVKAATIACPEDVTIRVAGNAGKALTLISPDTRMPKLLKNSSWMLACLRCTRSPGGAAPRPPPATNSPR